MSESSGHASNFLTELESQFDRVRDLATESEVWMSRPAWLEFAPNNLCNLRCIMCGQSEEWPLELMPKQKALDLLDQVLPAASLFTPSAISEPMLSDIRTMVQKCREHDVYLDFTSNATVLNGGRLRQIADRMHQLFVSFDSHVPEVFEAIRARASYAKVVENIKSILPVSAEFGFPVDFVAVMMTKNIHHLDGLVDFLADLGAAELACELRIQLLVGSPKPDLDPFVTMSEQQIGACLDRACERAKARGMRFRAELPAPFHRSVQPRPPRFRWVMGHMVNCLTGYVRDRFPQFCSMATYHFKVAPTGKVYPCCRAPEDLVMGNVNEQSVDEIWNGPKYREFRRRMFSGDYPETCKTCDVLTANPKFRAPTAAKKGAGDAN